MDCSDFLARFSEYFDGRDLSPEREEMEVHEARCVSCREYRRAVDAGGRLIRSLPLLEVPQDFRPRLDHRIYHIEDGESIARESLGSGAATAAVLAMAVLLAAVAWTPTARGLPPVVELPAVVVRGESHTPPAFTSRPLSSTFSRRLPVFAANQFQDGLWGDPHKLLFEYSSFSHRRRGSEQIRVGIE